MTVDIILNTRNRPLFLTRAVDDILAQTHQDWRVLIVNDGGEPGPQPAQVNSPDRWKRHERTTRRSGP